MVVSPDPAYLICTERCGSNLIRAMLDAHPEVYAPVPLHMGRNFGLRLYRYGDLRKTENWHWLIGDLVTILNGVNGKDLELTAEELKTKVTGRTFKDLYSYIYDKGLAKYRKSRLFIKEIHTYQQAFFLIRYFPNAQFVLQVRDPRDYLASCKKSGERFDKLPASLSTWAQDQTRSLELAYALPPEQVFIQRYEDLLQAPELVLRSLCAFLHLEFDPAMLAFHQTEAAQRAAKHNQYWQNLDKPLMAENHGKYRQVLTPIEVDMVEHRVGTLMRHFGYALESETLSYSRRKAVELYERLPHGFFSKMRDRVSGWASPEMRKTTKAHDQLGKQLRAEHERIATPVTYAYLGGGNGASGAADPVGKKERPPTPPA
jgi:hypothetical protein